MRPGRWVGAHLGWAVGAATLVVSLVLVGLFPFGGEVLLGHELSDMPDHLQGSEWFFRELSAGRLPVRAGWMFFPEDPLIWYPDPVGALLYSALRLVLDPILAWNSMILLLVGSNTTGALWVGRRIGGWKGASLLAISLGPSAYTIGAVHSGLTELLAQGPGILLLGLCWAAAGLPTEGWRPSLKMVALGGGIAFWCSFLASPYLAVGFGLGAIGLGMVSLKGPDRRGGLAIFGALILGSLLALPLLWHIRSTLAAEDAAIVRATAPGWNGVLPIVDVLAFILPDYAFPDMEAVGNPGIRHVQHVGLVSLLLGLIGLIFARRAALPLAWAALCAMGPILSVAGKPVLLGGFEVSLPVRAFFLPVWGEPPLHHPYRLVVGLLPILACCATLAVRRLPGLAVWGICALILGETLLATPAPWPIATTTVPEVVRLPPGARLDWPPDATTWNRRYRLGQVRHGQAIPYGVNVFLPASFRGDPLIQRLGRLLEGPRERRARNRGFQPAGDPWRGGRKPELLPCFLVLHPEAMSPNELERSQVVLREALGEPLDGAATVWAWGGPGDGCDPDHVGKIE